MDDIDKNELYSNMSSNNVEFVQGVFCKAKEQNSIDLYQILTECYNKLLLNNVSLSANMNLLIREKLLELCFFQDSDTPKKCSLLINQIEAFLNQLIEAIDLLLDKYKENDTFVLYTSLYIAKHIHILKRFLKSTYGRIPWEEIEFCLVTFVASNKRLLKEHCFYNSVLTKGKLLLHLKTFSACLKQEKDLITSQEPKSLIKIVDKTREEAVKDVVKNNSSFKSLYTDYSLVRNFSSLSLITSNINFVLSAICNNNEGQLIITRALLIIGEHMKTSIDSPNLSDEICKHVLSSLSKNTLDIITNLRDSVSHYKTISSRLDIEQNSERYVFGIQNDLKKVSAVTFDVLCKIKSKWVTHIFEETTKCESIKEIKSTLPCSQFRILSNERRKCTDDETLKQLENLFISFKSMLKREKRLNEVFKEIFKKISSEKLVLRNIKTDIIRADFMLKNLTNSMTASILKSNDTQLMKLKAKKALKVLALPQLKSNLNVFSSLALQILDIIGPELSQELLHDVRNIVWDIVYAVEFKAKNVKFMEEFKDNVCKSIDKKKGTGERINEELQSRISLLKDKTSESLSGNILIENYLSYKTSKSLQMLVETILIDIMSILEHKKRLSDNPQYLTNFSPQLIGKSLRNYLAHGDNLYDILLVDANMDILLNVRYMINDYNNNEKQKIGKTIPIDPSKMKIQFNKDLAILNAQNDFFNAVLAGDLQTVDINLNKRVDINSRDVNLDTALHFASMGIDVEIVKYIINKGIDPLIKNVHGQTPLHLASKNGSLAIVKYLIELNLSVNEVDVNFQTPLHLAAQNGYADVVQLLLANKADFPNLDINGYPPLHYALIENHDKTATLLLNQEKNVIENANDFSWLHVASESGNLNMVCKLLEKNVNVNSKTDRHYTPLHAAAKGGNIEIINALLDKGAEINSKCKYGFTPLFYAAIYANKGVVHQLIEKGASKDIVDNLDISSPLIMAIEYGNLEAVEQLLEEGIDDQNPNYFGMVPLHFAAAIGHIAIANLLINKDNINSVDSNLMSALHFSAMYGHLDMVMLLVKKGADLNLLDINERTALHHAAEKGFDDTVRYLLLKGTSVHLKDVTSMTALHLSVLNQHKDVSKTLITFGANVSDKSFLDITPFHIAIGTGCKETIEFFIASGASLDSEVFTVCSPLHLGVLCGNQEVLEYMLENAVNVASDANALNLSILHLAIKENCSSLIKFLTERNFNIYAKDEHGSTLLDHAVKRNNLEIVKYLLSCSAIVKYDKLEETVIKALLGGFNEIVELLLDNISFDVNKVVNCKDETLLHFAAKHGHKKMVETLLSKSHAFPAQRCNFNARSKSGSTPLHLSALEGHSKIVEMLLEKEFPIKSSEHQYALELAVKKGHLEVVKLFGTCKELSSLKLGKHKRTLLHIAAQEGKLDIAHYLVEIGASLDALDILGYKPIHLAALFGHKDMLEYLLNLKPIFISELCVDGVSLLHLAVSRGHLNVTKYLIKQNIGINITDTATNSTALHLSAVNGNLAIIKLLIKSGAFYDSLNNDYQTPMDCCHSFRKGEAFYFLTLTGILFDSIENKNYYDLQQVIEKGVIVNTINSCGLTPLHIASEAGDSRMVDQLLKYGANPNIADGNGNLPLHIASGLYSYSSNLDIVISLLLNGAIYNPENDNENTPLHYATPDVKDILQFIDDSFRKVKDKNLGVLQDFSTINDRILECVRNTKSKEHISLRSIGEINDFSDMQVLEQTLVSEKEKKYKADLRLANDCFNCEEYEQSFCFLQNILMEGKKYRNEYGFLSDLDIIKIKEKMGNILLEQFKFHEAFNVLQQVFLVYKERFGINNENTLKTRRSLAILKHKRKLNVEALIEFQNILVKQISVLQEQHVDVIITQRYLSLSLSMVENYTEALKVNSVALERITKCPGEELTICTIEHDRSTILARQGKYNEALRVLKHVYNVRKELFGNKPITLRTKRDTGALLFLQGKPAEALNILQGVLSDQREVLKENSFDILSTHTLIGDILYSQNKIFSALNIYKLYFERRKEWLGPQHPDILDTIQKMEHIECTMFLENHGLGIIVLEQHFVNKSLPPVLSRQNSTSSDSGSFNGSTDNLECSSKYLASESICKKIENLVSSLQITPPDDGCGLEFLSQQNYLKTTSRENLFKNYLEEDINVERLLGIVCEDPLKRVLKMFNKLANDHKNLFASEKNSLIFNFIKMVNKINEEKHKSLC